MIDVNNPSIVHLVLAAFALFAVILVFVPYFTCKDEMVMFDADSTVVASAIAAGASTGTGCNIFGLPQLDDTSMWMEIVAMASSSLSFLILCFMIIYYDGKTIDNRLYPFALWSAVLLSAVWWILKAVRFVMLDSRNNLALISMVGGLSITIFMVLITYKLSLSQR